MKFPLLGKTLAVGGVLLALTLALQSIGGIVAERAGRLRDAERSVADSLASQQTLLGPALLKRCEETWTTEQGEGKERKLVAEKREFALAAAPATLDVNAKATIETRHRGLFKVNGYAMKATLKAHWADIASLEPVAQHVGGKLHCDAPLLFVAVGDARGIRVASVKVRGAALPVLPGTGHASHPRGFHAVVPAAALQPAGDGGIDAEVGIDLVGTAELAFAPVADATHVVLSSDWRHPSFGGRFLPTTRTIDGNGFNADWQLSALATSAPQDFLRGAAPCTLDGGTASDAQGRPMRCIETFGVGFIDPVSGYVLSDRATKYGLLFIALTFVAVALVEVLRRLRVHPVQYLLVGSALAVFFLLLVSLTEHIAFAWAYLAASAACTLLLTFYASFVLRGARAGALFGAGIALLYGALYMLLQMEQSALVLGSLLLFAVLGAVMIATRRVDWYALMEQLRRESAPVAAKPIQ